MRSCAPVALLLTLSCTPSLPDDIELVDVAGCVTVPEGVAVTEVVNALGSARLTDGCYTLTARAEGPMLAMAVGAGDVVIRMGWISVDEPDLTARTTADALLWMALGGPGVGFDYGPLLVHLLARDDRVQPVADALDAALVAGGVAAYREPMPAVADAITEAALDLLAVKPGEGDDGKPRHAVLVDPGDAQSGLTVTQTTGVNQVSVANTYRRSGAIFIDRVSTFDDEGRETPAPLSVVDAELASITALKNGIEAVNQLVRGSLQPGGIEASQHIAYVPRTHGPYALDPVPDARKTRYEVVVVGPGLSAGAFDDLTAAQATRQLDTSVAFMAREFVVPLLLQVAIPAAGLNEATDSPLTKAIVQDVIRVLATQLPEVGPQAAKGDVVGAAGRVWDALATSATVRAALFAVIAEQLYDFRTAAAAAGTTRAGALAAGFARVTGAVDAFLTTGDATFIAGSLARSNQADVWTVDVTESTVRFAPRESTVNAGSRVRLEVNVLDAPDDAALEYRFSTPGAAGTLANDLREGDAITSSQGWIDYLADDEEGTDTVKVEVYDIRLAERVYLGTSSASIEVTTTCTPEPIPTVAYEAFTEGTPRECTLGPCHNRSAVLTLRFERVPGVSTYVISEDSVGVSSFQPGWELRPFILGELGHSWLTHEQAISNIAGYVDTPPLQPGEAVFQASRMLSDVIREGDPSTLQAWLDDVDWWVDRNTTISIRLVPQCEP